jgi:hypothetical protein
MMAAMEKKWRGAVALGGIIFLCVTTSPSSAGEVEDRIVALEEI